MSAMSSIIKYHAPRDFKNLSSALSYRLYGEIKSAQMRWVPLSSCQDYVIAGGYNLSNVGHKAHVWCAGYTKPYGPSKRPEKIYSVRGPLSQARAKQHMNVSTPCAGDPLLLISDIHDVSDADLRPCFFTKEDSTLFGAKQGMHGRYITVNDSLDTILISIKNASYVLTDLLEGIVLADAFTVRSAYVCNKPPPFAVRDYLGNFTASDKDIVCPNDIEVSNENTLRCRNISSLKNALLTTLPNV